MLRLLLCTSLLALSVSCSANGGTPAPGPPDPPDAAVSPDASVPCDYHGTLHADGEIFPAADGCNSCQCNPNHDTPGQVGCTLLPCEYPCTAPHPSDGCSEEECVPDGECGGNLYHCDTTTGTWRMVGYCEPWFPLDVHGVWALALALDGPDPCPDVTRVDPQAVHVGSGSAQYVLRDDAGVELGVADVIGGHHQAHAGFELTYPWSAADGAPVSATLRYTIDIAGDGPISGHAFADVAHGDAVCHYGFVVTGTWSPPSP